VRANPGGRVEPRGELLPVDVCKAGGEKNKNQESKVRHVLMGGFSFGNPAWEKKTYSSRL